MTGARAVSSLLADKGLPVWQYRFSYVADSIGQPGAQHAAEIPYFFDTVAIIALGANATLLNADVLDDETELKKVLTTLTLAASPLAVFDNVARGGQITSPGLSNYLTATIYGDRLLGSKVAAASLELRAELFGPLSLARQVPVPVQVAPFFDAGIAWSEPSTGPLGRVPRQMVSSEGVTLRINILGIAIGALSYAIPNQRPLVGHVWQFDLLPAF